MGGYGSGGYRHGERRPLASHCYVLDAATLHRAGAFSQAGRHGFVWQWGEAAARAVIDIPADRSELVLKIEHQGEHSTQTVRISRTACRMGGARYWLHCPLCRRRAQKLFLYSHLYSGGQRLVWFLCRQCLHVTYATKNEKDPLSVGQRRAMRIRHRLGATGGMWDTPPDKPKWMRWETYARNMEQFIAAVELAESGFIASAVKHFPGMFDDLLEREAK